MIRCFADLYAAIHQHPRVTTGRRRQDKEALLCGKLRTIRALPRRFWLAMKI